MNLATIFNTTFAFLVCYSWSPVKAEDSASASFVSQPENATVPESATASDGSEIEKNFVKPSIVDATENLLPSVEVSASFDEKIEDTDESAVKQIFAEATTNSGIANDLASSGQPVVVTLQDVATAELHERAAIPPSQHDLTPKPSNQTVDLKEQPSKDNLTEEIPSFSEWTQKRLEEAEKDKESSNISSQQHNTSNGKAGAKLRWKNYASLDCGAKVVASNPEAVSPSAILSPSRDEYKLNTCTSRIWFIVELCEAIQAKKIDFANFELFSSSPKDFTVSVSDRFPTREWSNVGQFTAKDERDIQSFDLHPHLFGKYIKVEVKSHYGSEHYCPISLFRVYGTSEFEVLQKEDPVHADRVEDEDLDDDLDLDSGDSSKNLFSSATDAVISMVKKAASVLGNKGNNSNSTDNNENTKKIAPIVKICNSPSHLIVCDNCSDVLFGQIYQLLSCREKQIRNLVHIPLIRNALVYSNVCNKFGFNFKNKHKEKTMNSQFNCIKSFFPEYFIGAMCNSVAILENKVLLNMSSHYSNTTVSTEEDDKIVNIKTPEPRIVTKETLEIEKSDVVVTSESPQQQKSSCSTDVSYAEQIKPTKTFTGDRELQESHTEAPSVASKSDLDLDESSEEIKVNSTVVDKSTEFQSNEQVTENNHEVETVENLDDHLEQFINEFNGPNAPSSASATPHAQKESVFLRLSNRIKALERNMSLSGQYLEELSKRYKKQVEEMQKLLEKTVVSMNEEIRRKDKYNQELEERLNELTDLVEDLVKNKNSWLTVFYCVLFSVLSVLFLLNFIHSRGELPDDRKSVVNKRRKSIDLMSHVETKKKRRPSDQAMKIVRSSMVDSEQIRKRKKNNRKQINRSNSINNLNEEGGFQPSLTSSRVWDRQVSAPIGNLPSDWVETKKIEEIPFVLEESEHSSLEPLSLTTEKVTVPSIFKTALSARSERVEVNGVARKSASVDETGKYETPKKEKKGFKKIFKKVF